MCQLVMSLELMYGGYEQIHIHYLPHGSVAASISTGGHFCCNFVANKFRYLHAEITKIRTWFEKTTIELYFTSLRIL